MTTALRYILKFDEIAYVSFLKLFMYVSVFAKGVITYYTHHPVLHIYLLTTRH